MSRRVFETPEELEIAIDNYFKNELIYAITGLALFLGFESRQSFYDYEKMDGYSYAIKRARTRIELSYEIDLRKQSNSGAIFALKNMGWTDKQEVEQTVITPKAPVIEVEQ